MQHPIIHNSVIDRVQLTDAPPSQEDLAHLSHPDEEQVGVERPEGDEGFGGGER